MSAPTGAAILTTSEAAGELRKSKAFVLREIERKNLRASFYGGAWHITHADLQTYIDANANVSKVTR